MQVLTNEIVIHQVHMLMPIGFSFCNCACLEQH